MSDQAALLRRMRAAAGTRPWPVAPCAHAVVIGSGKGGVGKSALSVMLAAELARLDRRVLLLDGSQNQGNLHVMLGVRPAVSLGTLLGGDVTPEELLVPVAEGVVLLPADSGTESLHALSRADRARLHHRLCGLYDAFDAVVVDAGPGIESVVRVSSMRASRLVVVAVPEPASLSDAYALIKIVTLQVPRLPIAVLVNRALGEDEGPATFERLQLAAGRFLGRELSYLGAVAEDPALRQLACRPGALLAATSPGVRTAAARLARDLCGPEAP